MQTSAAPVLKPVVNEIQLIPVDKIKPSPFNARKDFPKEYIAELGASLVRDGQQAPVKVRPKDGDFELVFGECRWRAGKLAGLEKLKAIVEPMDDAKAEHLCLIENLKRRDLSVFEEAEKLKRLHEVHKVKVEDLAVQVGISVRGVFESLKLATADASVREAVAHELTPLPVSHAKLIARLPKADQAKLVEEVMDGVDYNGMITHKALEEQIREKYMVDLRQAPFAVALTGIKCLAASCAVCPKNARNAKDEYPELKGADFCMSTPDYKAKAAEYSKAVVADAKKSGKKVLAAVEAEQAFSSSGKYVALNHELWVGNERKPLKDVLPKKAELETLLAIDDEGNAVEVVERSEAREVLKKAGKTTVANSYDLAGHRSTPSGSGGVSAAAESKKRRAAADLRKATAKIAIEKIAGTKAIAEGDDAFSRVMIAGFTAVRDYGETFKYLWRELHPESKEQYQLGSKIRTHANGLKGAELRKFAAKVALAEAMHGGGTYSTTHSQDLVLSAQACGVDLSKCSAEAKKAKDEKPAPAPKKADPLDSPAVAKAKAKKTAAKAKKGGAR